MRLTWAQRQWLKVIARQNDRGEDGHDLEGDLSLHTLNYGATHHSLIRRELVEARYDRTIHPEDGPWLYTITQKGLEAIGRSPLKLSNDGEQCETVEKP